MLYITCKVIKLYEIYYILMVISSGRPGLQTDYKRTGITRNVENESSSLKRADYVCKIF